MHSCCSSDVFQPEQQCMHMHICMQQYALGRPAQYLASHYIDAERSRHLSLIALICGKTETYHKEDATLHRFFFHPCQQSFQPVTVLYAQHKDEPTLAKTD